MEQQLLPYFTIFIASLATTAIITPPISKLARHHNIVDHPGLHKTHHEAKPLLGGLAIFLSIVLIMIIYSSFSGKLMVVLAGALVLVGVGLMDDIIDLKPSFKLSGQIAAASIVVYFNATRYHVILDLFERYNIPGFVALILIAGWIVLMINAINLIDGLDGLAAGTAAVIFAAMAAISFINSGSADMLGLKVVAFGASLGFLLFNYSPARIFMGDTGSMLLGYLLATTYLLSLNGSFSGSLVLGSIFIFAYPALDVSFAIFRRLRSRTSIFRADKAHIHHILISLGLSVRQVVCLIYLLNVTFALMAVVMLSARLSAFTVAAVGFFTVVSAFYIFSYLSKISKANGLHPVNELEELLVEQRDPTPSKSVSS